ncbi:MAG: WD40 repeat domain-containing protein [Chloroflexota bacterium]|nr:WD40 repeat domain-containing protein [Chloroflexota bacterium]
MSPRTVIALLFCFVLASVPVSAQPEFTPLPVEGYGSQVVPSPDGAVAVAFTDARAAMIANMDLSNGMTIIDMSDNSVVTALDGPVDLATSVAFNADGALLAVVHANGDVALWNTADWSLRDTHATLHMNARTLGFLPDGQTLTLLTSGTQPLLLFMDVTSGAIVGMAGRHYTRESELRAILSEPQGLMRTSAIAAALAPDGLRYAAANGFDEIVIREIETHDWFTAREGEGDLPQLSIAHMVFANNHTLVYMLRSGELHEFDVETRTDRLIATVADRLFMMDVSRDGSLIAAVTHDPDALFVLDRATGAVIQQVSLPSPQLAISLNFTPDNSAILLGVLNTEGTGPAAAILRITP